jgi:phosphatidylinositol alpha-mannosyltransferase
LLFVGNWRDRRKGLPVLLEAFQSVRAQGIEATLDVIGEGKPSESQRGIPGVTFLGVIGSEADLADHYRRCDLFVAPATGQESFGIVLIEAMACGRPVVCSDIRGYRDVIDPEGAELVPAGDPAALARVIADLACAHTRRVAMGARNRVRAEAFDWSRIAHRVRDVYTESISIRTRLGAAAE